jgi:putative thioredoxin
MLVADVDLMGGHVDDAFARLISTVQATSGDERNTVRLHLLELFEVVGADDDRVMKARRRLMSVLF